MPKRKKVKTKTKRIHSVSLAHRAFHNATIHNKPLQIIYKR